MRKIILLTLSIISLQVSAQELNLKELNVKDFFKFGTVYGAVNGANSISDQDIYSVTDGLETSTVKTPFDYSILIGVRKIRQFGYQPKEAFKRGTESSFSDGSTIGRWTNKVEFLFQGELKRQQGGNYFDQKHFVRYVADKWLAKIEYVKDGFADVEYFEASQRYTYKFPKLDGLSLNIGIAQRIAEPYGYDPLEEWLLSNGNLHYTHLALQEGYSVEFDGMGGETYFNPSGNEVATSTEVWEDVVIPEVLSNYTEKKRNELPDQWNYSWIAGFDYYKYSKTSWLHAWGNMMPLHYSDDKNEFSYYNFNGGQWVDYSGGIILGHWFNKNLGVFIEGTYNKYWNRQWHGFSAGINYRVF